MQTVVFFGLITYLLFMNWHPGFCYAADNVDSVPISNTVLIPVINEPGIIIRVKQDKTVLLEKNIYLDELEGMTLTKQIYTSLDADDTPQLILAEGILITDLLKVLGVKLEDVQDFHIFSSEGWHRSFTKKFLFDVPRFAYPEILPVQEQGQQSTSDKELKEDIHSKDENKLNDGEESNTNLKYAFEDKQPVPMQPMLTFRCYEKLMEVFADWEKLSNSNGIRVCYGQINLNDVCSTLYGKKINQLEINIKTINKNESNNGYIAQLIGGCDDAAGDEVIGSAGDAASGKQIANVPSTLTIKAGYYGQDYKEIKTFSLAELKSLPKIKQAYTFIDKDLSVIVETAVGVRLVDLLAAAGIDPNSVQFFHLYSYYNDENTAVSLSKGYLIDMPRYFYPRLPSCWDRKPTTGAARGGVRVDTIIALKDYWDQSTKAPDFFNVNGNNRFRLVLGQSNTTAETASSSLPWIHTIAVQISGSRTEGDGTRISAGSGAKGANDSQGQTEKMDLGEEIVAVEQGTTQNPIKGNENARIYTVAPAKAIPMEEQVYCLKHIGLISLAIFTLGAMIRYFGYRRENNLLSYKVR
ncbi:MAG: hypothetical protein ACOX6L_02950 [Syntrophomonadaceae bacterium]